MSDEKQTITDKERLDYGWKHFALIADQRIKTFNFYILILVASFSATITMLKPTVPRHDFCLVGMAHMLAAFIFWLIDVRSVRILKVSIQMLKDIERSPAFKGHPKIMVEDDYRQSKGWWRLVTYRTAFRVTFFLHALFGLVLAASPHYFLSHP